MTTNARISSLAAPMKREMVHPQGEKSRGPGGVAVEGEKDRE
jgi:hypothetical protein